MAQDVVVSCEQGNYILLAKLENSINPILLWYSFRNQNIINLLGLGQTFINPEK